MYDGSVMKIYITEVLRGTTSVMGYNTPRRVGINGGMTQVWKGILDDVSIYNKALSDQEVQDLYTHYISSLYEAQAHRGGIFNHSGFHTSRYAYLPISAVHIG